jgi:NAD(P)-dependent dehydrogenase (short-subunit alcohol dehydrogenase family)
VKPSVLITGASSGIGAASARLLAERGFDVFGASRRPLESGAGLRWIAMDVRSDESVERGVREALAAAGRLDALVCCAGYGIFGSVEETPIETARQQFETNLFGVLRALRAVVPGMREARRGRIAVVGSLAGRAPIPFQAHYSATKAALDALTLALRAELHPFGVGVSLIEPGDIRTPFNDAMDWGDPAGSAYGERAVAASRAIRELLPQAPGPERVARAVHRALTARRPRVRYTAGSDALAVPLGRRLLPDALMLRLIRARFRV